MLQFHVHKLIKFKKAPIPILYQLVDRKATTIKILHKNENSTVGYMIDPNSSEPLEPIIPNNFRAKLTSDPDIKISKDALIFRFMKSWHDIARTINKLKEYKVLRPIHITAAFRVLQFISDESIPEQFMQDLCQLVKKEIKAFNLKQISEIIHSSALTNHWDLEMIKLLLLEIFERNAFQNLSRYELTSYFGSFGILRDHGFFTSKEVKESGVIDILEKLIHRLTKEVASPRYYKTLSNKQLTCIIASLGKSGTTHSRTIESLSKEAINPKRLEYYTPEELCRIIVAMKKLFYVSEKIIKILIRAALIEERLRLYDGHLLANLILGLGDVKRYVNVKQIKLLINEAKKPERMIGCNAKDIRAILLGMEMLNVNDKPLIYILLAEALKINKIERYQTHEIVSILHCLSRLGFYDTHVLSEIWKRVLGPKRHRCNSRDDVEKIMCAFGTLGFAEWNLESSFIY